VTKAFPNVVALDDVSLDVRAGEILALIGENGAGKSTLLGVLGGEHVPDAGTVRLDGRPLRLGDPRAAHAAGIRVVRQEPEIVPWVDVAENIRLGDLPARRGFVDRQALLRDVRTALRRDGFDSVLSARTLGADLSSAQRQVVELMRAVRPGVRVLALDEPTSSLTDDEVEKLFSLVRRLVSEGVAIVYVSHRINEVARLADRVAVLRDGRLVALRPAAGLAEREMVRLMVGRELGDIYRRRRNATDRSVLEVRDVDSRWHRRVSLTVRAGEVVGLAGLVGAGRTELAKIIFGESAADAGAVLVGGRAVDIRKPIDAIGVGIGLAPEDRKREGLLLLRSVRENASLAIIARLTRWLFVRPNQERAVARQYVERLRVRTPSLEQEVGTLSGGNQQKVVLARWLAARPAVLILDEPTRGIDVGAKAEIYRLVDDLANEGIGVLYISSDLPEILGLSDRIYVMQEGRITGELAGVGSTEEQVLALAFHGHLTTAGTGGEPQS
jgi:L-arabinose transport system ATP-binding protein